MEETALRLSAMRSVRVLAIRMCFWSLRDEKSLLIERVTFLSTKG